MNTALTSKCVRSSRHVLGGVKESIDHSNHKARSITRGGLVCRLNNVDKNTWEVEFKECNQVASERDGMNIHCPGESVGW